MLINFQYSVAQLSPSLSVTVIISSGAVPGKAGKAAALPRFCKIESGSGSGGAADINLHLCQYFVSPFLFNFP